MAMRTWDTPQLHVHGTVGQITAGGGGNSPDTGGGNSALVAVPSDRALKERVVPVDQRAILQRVAELPIASWNYTAQPPSIRHIGPMAQDFAAAFGVGESDKQINLIDANGVALAAIQALAAQVQAQQVELEQLRAELAAVRRRTATGPDDVVA
ncbi:MAG: tail fiber domain-containing protein [Thermomicrobiales bacterium]